MTLNEFLENFVEREDTDSIVPHYSSVFTPYYGNAELLINGEPVESVKVLGTLDLKESRINIVWKKKSNK